MILLLIGTLIFSSCQTPQKIDVYYPGQEPVEGYVFRSIELNESFLTFEFTLNLADNTLLKDALYVESLELRNNDVGYGFGAGFGAGFEYGSDYIYKLDGVEVINWEDTTLSNGTEYELEIMFNLLDFDDINNIGSVEDVSLILVLGTIMVNLTDETN